MTSIGGSVEISRRPPPPQRFFSGGSTLLGIQTPADVICTAELPCAAAHYEYPVVFKLEFWHKSPVENL
jgi:hypothetical protein